VGLTAADCPSAEWWSATAPLLEKVIDGRRFPVASRVGTSAGETFDAASDLSHAMAFGLECISDARPPP